MVPSTDQNRCPLEPVPSARATFFSIPDLLAIVFRLSLSAYPSSLVSTSLTLPPLLFTRVNRLWRDVALATPHLWADLFLVSFPTLPNTRLAANHHRILMEWLIGSKNIPLSLTLKYFANTVGDVKRIERILSAILPHAERWHDLQVTAPMPCLKAILNLMGKDSPLLQKCKICITSTRAHTEDDDLVLGLDDTTSFRISALTLKLGAASNLKELDMKTEALTDLIYIDLPPSLRTLSLDNFDLLLGPPGIDTFAVCCAGLKRIKLHSSVSVELVRQLSIAFPHLEEAFLDVRSEIQQADDRNEHGGITFSMLHTLTLCTVQVSPSRSGTADMRTLDILLSSLNLPSLACLHLKVSYAPLGSGAWFVLHEFLLRSHILLRELKISGVLFQAESVLSLLRDVGSTVQKVCVCVPVTTEVMAALTLREGTEGRICGLCPHLTHLDIPLSSLCLTESVIAMLRSRCSPSEASRDSSNVSLLQECRLVLSDPGALERIECHPDIVRYVERGLSLDVRSW